MLSRSKPVALAVVLALTAAVPVAGQTGRGTAGCAPDAKTANLNFTLKDLDGRDVTLSAYKGKVVLLDFWATWCAPCKVEIPGFIELFSKYRSQGLQVLGFAVDDPVPALKAYAKEMGMNYPVLVGQGRNDVLEAFGPMVGLPTTLIIGRDGRICSRHMGFTPKDRFERDIRTLLTNLL
ncbi:MAG: TlpA family protein disulfide reductase [Acidobacteria bacterium]|nr:TlpA family protein disulfide reductase [Acidobacteriota bacterium]